MKDWPADALEADKMRFYEQLGQLNSSYPGGMHGYVENARKLLAESKAGVNPLEGWQPSFPAGKTLDFAGIEFLKHEELGLAELDGCAFVLVAGGLGERLGFSGIKVALPWQITSGETYLELYIRNILALQREASARAGKSITLPLAIMVSDDTAARTDALLKANDNYGMAHGQIRLLKQEKVPCLLDNDARLAPNPKDPYQIMTKPHGHGDVHFLLHSSGTLREWQTVRAPPFKLREGSRARGRALHTTPGLTARSPLCSGRRGSDGFTSSRTQTRWPSKCFRRHSESRSSSSCR